MWLARLALGLVHQLVRALNQIGRQPPRDEAPIGDAPEPEADDADVDANRLCGEPPILERPIVAFHRFAKAFADRVCLRALGDVRDEEAEFVAAEPRVQILCAFPGTLLRDQVVGPHLLAKQVRHPSR